jgi:hypothetical protein
MKKKLTSSKIVLCCKNIFSFLLFFSLFNSLKAQQVDIPAHAEVLYSIPIGSMVNLRPNNITAADPASVYSNTTTFTGQAFSNGGQANTPAITKLIADDLNFIGTPPFSIGRFDFNISNLNAVAVSARPRVRFYLDNAGVPGTLITGFSFNAITVAANSTTTLFATVAPFSVTANKIWAAILFDNSGGTATAAQMDFFGMGIYGPVDFGTSADLFYQTTAAPSTGTSFLSNNPGPGGTLNFSGAPPANFGWDFRLASTITSVVSKYSCSKHNSFLDCKFHYSNIWSCSS